MVVMVSAYAGTPESFWHTGRPRAEHDPALMRRYGRLRDAGLSVRKIAGELGISATTVQSTRCLYSPTPRAAMRMPLRLWQRSCIGNISTWSVSTMIPDILESKKLLSS